MDWGDMNIKVYDAEGRFLRTVGRQGQGPGEFGTPSSFELLSGGRICLLDGGQHRVTILTTDGQYLSSFLVEGFHRDVAVDGQDRLYLGKWAAVKQPDQLSGEFQEVPYVTSIFGTDVTGKSIVHLLDLLGESVSMKAWAKGSWGWSAEERRSSGPSTGGEDLRRLERKPRLVCLRAGGKDRLCVRPEVHAAQEPEIQRAGRAEKKICPPSAGRLSSTGRGTSGSG